MTDERDLIIIGGGPAGYTAALYAARANLKPLVIEGFNWGGQLMVTSDVENYPGYADGVMGPAMMADFRRQAERFEHRVRHRQRDEGRLLPASVPHLGAKTPCTPPRSVIVATGASARWLGLRVRGAAQGARRLGMRDLRRRLLPRQAHRRRRRRRLPPSRRPSSSPASATRSRSSTGATSSAPRRSWSTGAREREDRVA